MMNIPHIRGAIDASGCVSNGWNLLKPKYWMYFGMTLLMIFGISCIPCVNFLLLGPITGGVYYVVLRDMRGEPVDFTMMFKGFQKFVPLMVIGLLQSIPAIFSQALDVTIRISDAVLKVREAQRDVNFYQASSSDFWLAGGMLAIVIVVCIVFLLVSMAWAVTCTFAIPLAMEHDLGPIEAIKLSARGAWSNLGGLIVLFILEVLLTFAGALAFCIGILFVLPLCYVAWAFAYRQVFPHSGPNQSYYSPPFGQRA